MMLLRLLVVLSVAAAAGGCGLGSLVGEPTSYERVRPAEFDIARGTQGKVAVLVQGGPSESVRRGFTDAFLLELERKTRLGRSRLVPGDEIEKLRQNGEQFRTMTAAQVGAAAGATAVLAVKIGNYELYPLPLGSYYDGSTAVSATLVDVESGAILWPASGVGRELSLNFDAEHGDPGVVAGKMMLLTAHGIVRYLYDCPEAAFRIPGEKGQAEWDNF